MFKLNQIRIYPLFLMGILLLAQLILGRFVSFAGALGRSSGMAAAVCLLLGILLILLSALQFRLRRTTVDPTKSPNQLVTNGLFWFSRNPMYLGMLLILLVQPLLTMRHFLIIFTLIFFLIMNYWVIPREEKVIEAVFGDIYRNYKAKTRRWI